MSRRFTTDHLLAAALGLAALMLYVVTLAPSVATVFDDSLEFQVVLPSLGIAHPTGYPLYTLLGWLWSHLLPVGDLAHRVNLLSAVAAALTVSLLYLAARRLNSGRLPAAVAASIFAVGPVWWSQATVAEVYALHGLFVALILLLTLDQRRGALLLACGLALTHHRMALLLAPGVAIYLLWSDPGLLRRPRSLLKLALAFLAPLLLYLYLPLRGQTVTSLAGAHVNTWDTFWRHVLASDYGTFFSANPLAVERPATFPLQLLHSQIGLAALLFGLLGWLALLKQPRRWVLLALLFAANFLFALNYKTADVEVFYLPALLIWLVVAAQGFTALLRWRTLPAAGRVLLSAALAALFIAQPLRTAWQAMQITSPPQTCADVLQVGQPASLLPQRRAAWSALNCGRAMLEQPLTSPATVIGLQGEITLLRYMQLDRGLQPDLHLLDADAESARLAAVAAQLAAGRAVYLTRELPGLPQQYSLRAVGPLVQVLRPEQATQPAQLPAVDLPFGDAVRLTGFRFAPVPATGATWLRLEAAWHVLAPVSEELKVAVRLLQPDGSVLASIDAVPVHWAYPTTAWRAGETILDAYDFALPADTDTAALTPLLILYRAADGTEVGRYQP